MSSHSFLARFLGVLRLDRPTFEGIKKDSSKAGGQAWLIVIGTVVASLIAGVIASDSAISRILSQSRNSSTVEPGLLLGLVLGALGVAAAVGVMIQVAMWFISSALVRWAGMTFLGVRRDACTPGQMRSLLGWAYAPLLFDVLAPVPVVGGLIWFVVAIWIIATGVVAVRTAFGGTTGRALAATIIAGAIGGLVVMVGLLVIRSAGIDIGANR